MVQKKVPGLRSAVVLGLLVVGLASVVTLVQRDKVLRYQASADTCTVNQGYYDVWAKGLSGTVYWGINCGGNLQNGSLNLNEFLPSDVYLGYQNNPYTVTVGTGRYTAAMTLQQACQVPNLPAPAQNLCDMICTKIDCNGISGSLNANVASLQCSGNSYNISGNGSGELVGTGYWNGVYCKGEVKGSGGVSLSLSRRVTSTPTPTVRPTPRPTIRPRTRPSPLNPKFPGGPGTPIPAY